MQNPKDHDKDIVLRITPQTKETGFKIFERERLRERRPLFDPGFRELGRSTILRSHSLFHQYRGDYS